VAINAASQPATKGTSKMLKWLKMACKCYNLMLPKRTPEKHCSLIHELTKPSRVCGWASLWVTPTILYLQLNKYGPHPHQTHDM